MPEPIDPSNPPLDDIELEVVGSVPTALSGRWVGVSPDGGTCSVRLDAGRAWVRMGRARTPAVVRGVVAFEGSVFAYGDDGVVRRSSAGLDAWRPVDLGGRWRPVATCPSFDPPTGELHLVVRDQHGSPAHVVIGAGAMTRRLRPILAAPHRVRGLVLDPDHVVYTADGVIGVAPRHDTARANWVTTEVEAPQLVGTYRDGRAVVVIVLTPALERWILHPGRAAAERQALDPAPRRHARINPASGWIWSTGAGSISTHDVSGACRWSQDLDLQMADDFVLVPGQHTSWFVGLLRGAAGAAELRVIDTGDPTGSTVATVRLPSCTTPGLRCAWLPSTEPARDPNPQQGRTRS